MWKIQVTQKGSCYISIEAEFYADFKNIYMSDIFYTSWAYSCIFNEAVIMKCYNKNQEKGSYNISIDAKFYFNFKITKFSMELASHSMVSYDIWARKGEIWAEKAYKLTKSY